MASDARNIHLEGVQGFLIVVGYVAHQRTRRQVRMAISAETVLAVADAIRKCPRVLEHGKPHWIGHALWHIDNPDAPPCLKETFDATEPDPEPDLEPDPV